MTPGNLTQAIGGPLKGLKIIEIESIGPGPFAAMTLADLGANVLRIARPTRAVVDNRNPLLARGRSGTLTLDLKEQNTVRQSFRTVDGVTQPNSAPRFSRTPAEQHGSSRAAEPADAQLDAWGLTRGDIL
jgi:crotonobetainyl-CoA:carnitine CoA-transferase CaiB-like acyl-CoA transferase